MVVSQTKEEREAKDAKVYLGNVQVVWTNGDNVAVAPREGVAKSVEPKKDKVTETVGEDLPF